MKGSRRGPNDPGARRRARLGAIAGLLAAATALGVGQLVAGVTGANGSPVVAVGQLQIDFTPPWLKNFAINEFGSHDKLVLVSGILVVLGIFAAVIGVAATRRLGYGMAGLLVFAAIGLTAAATRPTASVASLLPTLAATAAAAIVLRVLIERIGAPAAARAGAGPQAWGDDAGGVAKLAAPDLPRVPDLAGAPGPAGPVEPGRRGFLAASVATAGAAAVAGLAGRLLAERSSVTSARNALKLPQPVPTTVPTLPPGVDLNIPGLASFITPNNNFYRVDTAIVLPEVDPSSWQLRIHGMVNREITITFDELLKRPLIEDYVTLCCVSNPVGGPYIGNALWLGASLASLLREAGIKAGADQLMCTSVDGFTSGTPVQTVMDGRDALLAVAMNGQPLPIAHGFPVRMVVPGLYGYVSATKWVTDINVTTFAGNYAYWAQRGWSQQAPIKTESRIDVPNGESQIRPGRTAVAGVAWAQHKGVEAVEVRVDQGPWNPARLAAVPDLDTWRQWVWEWDATSGNHVIEVRATDKTGYTQTAAQAQPEPNGASGYPSLAVTVG
ncbi:MAG TPA: molybdopterin-dependent oxidoreductase [Streptosporangiaceae bacterium]|nr:molybdopterin-dependent oxidoreductase [Streptosporangiaceae bacterium]